MARSLDSRLTAAEKATGARADELARWRRERDLVRAMTDAELIAVIQDSDPDPRAVDAFNAMVDGSTPEERAELANATTPERSDFLFDRLILKYGGQFL